jgi:hypothetical protein
MGIKDLFSKRQKRLRGETPDVYIYDDIPLQLRVQITYLFNECLGTHEDYDKTPNHWVYRTYKSIVEMLCREYGLFSLAKFRGRRDYFDELIDFFCSEEDPERIIDVIEVCFQEAEIIRELAQSPPEIMSNAIEELNDRFKEHGVGYRYENGRIVKVDSEFTHSEIVKPALSLLNEESYRCAQDEFLNAYDHFRRGENKGVLNEALKSFESTLKVICTKHGWKYSQLDTSSKLIDICIKKGLVPAFWQSHMTGLRSTLESGVPTARNRLGGHGQGSEPIVVPDYIVFYVLHMTAAAIVFLIRAEQEFSAR